MMLIGGIQKLTLIDFPGKIACTVFCLGCNFRCPWCYNPELVLPELSSALPEKINKHPKISEAEFFKFLKSRKGLIEGVVISGGEPTIQKDLSEFCRKIKKMGFLVKIDTNGSNPETLKKLIKNKLIDYIAMDVKAPLGIKSETLNPKSEKNFKSQISKYKKATGAKVDLNKIKKSIEIIKKSGIDYEFRTTVVPNLLTKEDIIQIAREIAPAPNYYLQNFRPELSSALPEKTIDKKFKKIESYSKEYLLEIQKEILNFFKICEIRT